MIKETSLLKTKGAGSCGHLHISVYSSTLEKFFTLLKAQHEKEKKKKFSESSEPEPACMLFSGVFVTVVHTELYNLQEFYGMQMWLSLHCKNK